MAAPDFPASPTVGQTYTAPSGLVYTWDGQVWNTSGGAASTYWTDTGTALQPTTTTRNLIIPAQSNDQLHLGGPMFAVLSESTSGSAGWLTNNPWSPQDATKASWAAFLDIPTDSFHVNRRAPNAAAGTAPVLLTVDANSSLTLNSDPAVPISRAITLYSYFNAAGGEPNFNLMKMRVNQAPVLSADYIGAINYQAAYATNTTRSVCKIICQATENHDAGGGGVQWAVWLNANRSTAQSQQMTFDNNGNFIITGSIAQKASGTTWANPSDPRLKQDVASYEKGLAAICALDPITYRLKAQPDLLCYGFDASAVQDVFPECVSMMKGKLTPEDEEETDILSFDMHPVLVAQVNAIKELAARVTALESK